MTEGCRLPVLMNTSQDWRKYYKIDITFIKCFLQNYVLNILIIDLIIETNRKLLRIFQMTKIIIYFVI